jgi:peroxiredoxin
MLAPSESAPSFDLTRLDGEPWSLDDALGDGTVLVVFLETDCPTCRLAVPYVERLVEALGPDGIARVVAVSQDGEEESLELVEAYGVSFPVLRDADLEVSRAFDPPSVPAFFLVRRDRTVERSSVGFEKEEINRLAEALLLDVGLEPRVIAAPDDGAPALMPGCSSRHLEPVMEDASAPRAEPIDLRPVRGARASRVEVPDDVDPYEYCMVTGYSPFLPVVPPTAARVDAFLAETSLAPEHVLGLVPPCYGTATVEKVAANAVMAGCQPEYMEVLFPMVRAVCDERFNLHGVQATTHSATPLTILSGPAGERLGFASGAGVFGNTSRANSTVGRALQLVMTNLGGAKPGEIDMATLASPGRFSYCIAENHRDSPWGPLHVDRGFSADDSAVTLFAGAGLTVVSEHTARTGAGVLRTLAASLATVWSWRSCGRVEAVVVLCPEHAATLAADGFTKERARDFLFHNTGVPLRAYDHEGTEGTQLRDYYEEIAIDGEPHYRKFSDPSQIVLVVAGGTAGKFSGIIGGWLSGPRGSQMVTYPVRS